MKRYLAVTAGVLVAAAAGGAVMLKQRSAAPVSEPVKYAKPLPPAVTVSPARERTFVDRLFVSGSLVARDEALVGAQIDGLRVVELLAEDGDRVEKDQVLARLDRSQLDALLAQNDAALVRADAAIAQARNQIDQSEAMREQAAGRSRARAKRSRRSVVITQQTLDQRIATVALRRGAARGSASSALAVAEADKRSREAERRELMVRIGRTEVRAPVAGIVSRRTARLGALAIGLGDRAVPHHHRRGDRARSRGAARNPLARLAVGMPAQIELPGDRSRGRARVRLIASEVDQTTRPRQGAHRARPVGTPARIGSFASGIAEVARRSAVARAGEPRSYSARRAASSRL